MNFNILAIETSTSICSVALANQDGVLAEINFLLPNGQDRLLAEATKYLLNSMELKAFDIDAVAISSGPGSFTGLRIGAAFAKGLCFDGKTKLVSVPTASALAYSYLKYNSLEHFEILRVLIPSHKSLFYAQDFNKEAKPVGEVQFEEKELLTEINNNYFLLDMSLEINKNNSQFYSAKKIAELGIRKFLAGEYENEETFVPSYFQDFVPKGYLK